MKKYKVAILGCGSRGVDAYGNLMVKMPNRFEINSLCEINPVVLEKARGLYGLKQENCFVYEKDFFKEKRGDILVIATQDRDHVRQAVKALELGYHILLEKPISPVKEELVELLNAQKKYGKIILVCHVLRYAPAYVKIKELLNSGVIGKLIRMEGIEQVSWWHQAHSFVRGNWRNESETSPMIMAKCCHDLDLIQNFIGSQCETVYSVGTLSFFNSENQPKGASDRCKDCKYKNTCRYSAELLYVDSWKADNCACAWPFNVVEREHLTFNEEQLRKAYENGPYGQCVFKCDNNVVDNQMVDMHFANGVNATLTMTAFTGKGGRIYRFHGTHGEIVLDESNGYLRLYEYNHVYKPILTEWKIKDLVSAKINDSFGHGGGDACMISTLCDIIEGKCSAETTLEASIESHLIALAAEESRKSGTTVKVHK